MSKSDAPLHRYFDGELPPAEREEVRRRIEADPALAAKLEGLREVRGLVRESVAADLRAEPVPSDALWARIEAAIDAPAAAPAAERARAAEPKPAEARPALRAIDGGAIDRAAAAAQPAPAPSPELRRRRIAGIVVGALALAAAVLLIVVRPGEAPTDAPIADRGTEPVVPDEGPPPTAAEEVARTEVLEVDFGDNSGAIFSVEGDDGERYAVVWLADVQPKRTAVE